jgi:hypothetical protein
MTEDELARLYGAIRSELNNLSVQNIRNTVAAAGFDVSRITARSEARGEVAMGSRAEVMPQIDKLFGEMAAGDKERTLNILAERLINERLTALLRQHGFEFLNGSLMPVGMIDVRERQYLPPSAVAEIEKALSRLTGGDESGAITAACGAVDITTQSVYMLPALALGDPGQVSFSAKVNTGLQRLGIFQEMENELTQLGIRAVDAHSIVEEIQQATNHAAQALQMLRRTMGDVHGSRPALVKSAYDSIKWASAICGLFEGKIEQVQR